MELSATSIYRFPHCRSPESFSRRLPLSRLPSAVFLFSLPLFVIDKKNQRWLAVCVCGIVPSLWPRSKWIETKVDKRVTMILFVPLFQGYRMQFSIFFVGNRNRILTLVPLCLASRHLRPSLEEEKEEGKEE